MCELLPPISEDVTIPDDQVLSNSKVEHLMMTMLDEKDKLMDDLQKAKEDYDKISRKLGESQADKEALLRQLKVLLPQVITMCVLFHFGIAVVSLNTKLNPVTSMGTWAQLFLSCLVVLGSLWNLMLHSASLHQTWTVLLWVTSPVPGGFACIPEWCTSIPVLIH